MTRQNIPEEMVALKEALTPKAVPRGTRYYLLNDEFVYVCWKDSQAVLLCRQPIRALFLKRKHPEQLSIPLLVESSVLKFSVHWSLKGTTSIWGEWTSLTSFLHIITYYEKPFDTGKLSLPFGGYSSCQCLYHL